MKHLNVKNSGNTVRAASGRTGRLAGGPVRFYVCQSAKLFYIYILTLGHIPTHLRVNKSDASAHFV
jgi:hypothetical protein